MRAIWVILAKAVSGHSSSGPFRTALGAFAASVSRRDAGMWVVLESDGEEGRWCARHRVIVQ